MWLGREGRLSQGRERARGVWSLNCFVKAPLPPPPARPQESFLGEGWRPHPHLPALVGGWEKRHAQGKKQLCHVVLHVGLVPPLPALLRPCQGTLSPCPLPAALGSPAQFWAQRADIQLYIPGPGPLAAIPLSKYHVEVQRKMTSAASQSHLLPFPGTHRVNECPHLRLSQWTRASWKVAQLLTQFAPNPITFNLPIRSWLAQGQTQLVCLLQPTLTQLPGGTVPSQTGAVASCPPHPSSLCSSPKGSWADGRVSIPRTKTLPPPLPEIALEQAGSQGGEEEVVRGRTWTRNSGPKELGQE